MAILVSVGGTATAALVVTGANVRDRSLTGADFQGRSIRPADLAKAATLRGKEGDRGEPGPQGSQGASGPGGGPGVDSSQPGPAPRGRTVVRWVGVIDYDAIPEQPDYCSKADDEELTYTPPGYSSFVTTQQAPTGDACDLTLPPSEADKKTGWVTVTVASDPPGVAKAVADRLFREWSPYPYFRLRFLDASGEPTDARATVVLYTSASEPTL